jgi:arsenite oxidase small subunit
VGTPFTSHYPDSTHPNALFKLADGSVVAYSLLCTHVCCTVSYDTSSELFVCLCHGSVFNSSGGVVQGPADTPLPMVVLQVDSAGNVRATGFSGTSPCIG